MPQEKRDSVVSEIEQKLTDRHQTLADAIRERELYFRMSVVGTCNLSCSFCHNEGAPTSGKMNAENADRAIAAAVRAGFTRVQLTGGEPLLRQDIDDFVRVARRHVDDVGVTTNGTYLPKRLDALMEAGLARIHVSLQTEPLEEAGENGAWGIPDWLLPTVERARSGAFSLRFNLPVPADCLDRADAFLDLLTFNGVDVKVFSVLPEGQEREGAYPLERLEEIVEQANARAVAPAGKRPGEVFIRGFRPPSGLRCGTCRDAARCMEQSHSLRLGADMKFRPCLATRDWDSWFTEEDLDATVREAALLALDYRW
ncbi:radical SAM protein [Streptomyces sp. MBT56]|nr:radical SAM protein [Streptomyces sp. MBT56]MBK3602501.1 radical SAM protein [Streptomyces sp. MBT54]MBK3615462.1 radical SAM protein [Streptomyces sp. MBT98]MBK6044909.1 radical SAM protein [Streptomyces sp. MBT55]